MGRHCQPLLKKLVMSSQPKSRSDYDVLIRTWNASATIASCLDAVLAQDQPPERIILLDSGSTDDTLIQARNYPVEIHGYPEGEAFHYSRSLNRGLALTTAPYIWILSSHSVPLGTDVARSMLAAFDTPEVGYVRIQKADDQPDFSHRPGTILHRSLHRPILPADNSCAMIRRSEWYQQPFSEQIDRCEDQYWIAEAFQRGVILAELQHASYRYLRKEGMFQKQWLDLQFVHAHLDPGYISWSLVRGLMKGAWVRMRNGRFAEMMQHLYLAVRSIGFLLLKRD